MLAQYQTAVVKITCLTTQYYYYWGFNGEYWRLLEREFSVGTLHG